MRVYLLRLHRSVSRKNVTSNQHVLERDARRCFSQLFDHNKKIYILILDTHENINVRLIFVYTFLCASKSPSKMEKVVAQRIEISEGNKFKC